MPFADSLRQELRLAWRQLWRRRGGAAAAVVTLTIGLAASTAMFALVDGVLIRRLPVRDQEALAILWREPSGTGGQRVPFTAAEVAALRRGSRTLSDAAGVGWHGAAPLPVVENGQPAYLRIAHVTGTFFQVLGATPVLGRPLQPGDDVAGTAGTLVISHGTWQRRYGGAADAIGRRLAVDGTPFVIVGVMPPGLDYPRATEGWTTVAAMAATAPNKTFADAVASELDVVARVHRDTPWPQAREELRTLLPVIGHQGAGVPGLLQPVLKRFADAVVGDVRRTVLALFGAVALVLLLACANVATLLLMHGEARIPELAVRAALGASRSRLAAQLLLESLLLTLAAAVLAVPVARLLLRTTLLWAPPDLPRLDAVALDGRVLLFGAGIALAAATAAALAPMLAVVRGQLTAHVGAGGRATSGRAARTGRQALVTVQLALAVTVVATTGLLAQSLMKLDAVDAGFAVDRLVIASLAVPQATASDRARHLRLLDDLVARLEDTGLAMAATPINSDPFSGVGWSVPTFTAEGQDVTRAAANPPLDLEAVHPGYFETFGMTLVRGRGFVPGDRQGAVPVAVVTEDVAIRTWPGQEPIGRRLKMGPASSEADWLTVVGVARPTRYRDLTAQRPVLYVPAEQLIVAAQTLAVRTQAPLADVAAAIRGAVRGIAPDVQVMAVTPLDDLRQAPLARPRFAAALIALFAGTALLLSAVGVFAVAAASVQQRKGELRVRMAFGATPALVRRLVLGEGLRLAAIGAAIGIAGALTAAQWLRELLFEIGPVDALSLAGAAALMLLSTLVACAVPAWRASTLEPMAVLRDG